MLLQPAVSNIEADLSNISDMLNNIDGIYIAKDQALQKAKTLTSSKVEKWSFTFIENYDYDENNPDNLVRAVWEVEALHPVGNKTIYYVDAITKEIVNLAETENIH